MNPPTLADRSLAPPASARESAHHRPGHGVGFWVAHVAFWLAAYAANILLCAVFDVDDPPAFILAEVVLCFVATAAMRQASHRQALLEWAGL